MTDTYLVWCPGYGHRGPDDGMPIHGACSACDAAETWAKRYERYNAEYTIAGGLEATVRVQDPGGEITEWTVCGYWLPSYRATEAK